MRQNIFTDVNSDVAFNLLGYTEDLDLRSTAVSSNFLIGTSQLMPRPSEAYPVDGAFVDSSGNKIPFSKEELSKCRMAAEPFAVLRAVKDSSGNPDVFNESYREFKHEVHDIVMSQRGSAVHEVTRDADAALAAIKRCIESLQDTFMTEFARYESRLSNFTPANDKEAYYKAYLEAIFEQCKAKSAALSGEFDAMYESAQRWIAGKDQVTVTGYYDVLTVLENNEQNKQIDTTDLPRTKLGIVTKYGNVLDEFADKAAETYRKFEADVLDECDSSACARDFVNTYDFDEIAGAYETYTSETIDSLSYELGNVDESELHNALCNEVAMFVCDEMKSYVNSNKLLEDFCRLFEQESTNLDIKLSTGDRALPDADMNDFWNHYLGSHDVITKDVVGLKNKYFSNGALAADIEKAIQKFEPVLKEVLVGAGYMTYEDMAIRDNRTALRCMEPYIYTLYADLSCDDYLSSSARTDGEALILKEIQARL